MATYRLNEQKNGVEITFAAKPEQATLNTLKSNGFKWNKKGGYWYAVQSAERIALAEKIANGEQTTPNATPKAKAEKANKYGIKIGDWFYMSWGYDQTNADFFQVVALVGASSVRIRQAQPEIISEEGVSGMSAYRTYNLTSEIMPPCSTVFINDNEGGDLKRVKSYAADGKSNPQIYMTSYADAHYLGSDRVKKCYESWYA